MPSKVEFPLLSKLILFPGLLIVFFPSLVFFVANHVSPAVPRNVSILTRMLMSAFGLFVCLIGFIPALVRANRAE